jgi:DNA repair exonuclease SbcCD ATPase subunit
MSVHELALQWVAQQVNGKILHAEYQLRRMDEFNGRIPDIVADSEVHEVEIFNIKKKVESYLKLNKRKTLWVIFETNPFVAFDKINLIMFTGQDFSPLNAQHEGIRTLEVIYDQKLESLRNRIGDKAKTLKTLNKTLQGDLLKLLNEKQELTNSIEKLKKAIQKLRSEQQTLDQELRQVRTRTGIYLEYKPKQRTIVSIRITPNQFRQIQPLLMEGE